MFIRTNSTITIYMRGNYRTGSDAVMKAENKLLWLNEELSSDSVSPALSVDAGTWQGELEG